MIKTCLPSTKVTKPCLIMAIGIKGLDSKMMKRRFLMIAMSAEASEDDDNGRLTWMLIKSRISSV